jgi:FkbM family methyltransferase
MRGWGRFIDRLNKPEYLFRPRQLKSRYEARRRRRSEEELQVKLPWGSKILINANEFIGSSILTLGIYDLSVTEVLARLVSRGELAIDAGANIGQMCCVMAIKSGKTGQVIAFEPCEQIYNRLSRNVTEWRTTTPGMANIELRREALSSNSGMGILAIPTDFDRNEAVASLEPREGTSYTKESVPMTTIDDLLGDRHAGVLKLDIEGHELQALHGAERALIEHRIRDIVFEDHRPFPTDVHRLLQSNGYVIFRISRTLFGPVLREPRYTNLRFCDLSPNYLATLDPERAKTAMRPRKWMVLTRFGHSLSGDLRPLHQPIATPGASSRADVIR